VDFGGGLRCEGEVEDDHCVSWAIALPPNVICCSLSSVLFHSC
jgi:hypothetical protein